MRQKFYHFYLRNETGITSKNKWQWGMKCLGKEIPYVLWIFVLLLFSKLPFMFYFLEFYACIHEIFYVLIILLNFLYWFLPSCFMTFYSIYFSTFYVGILNLLWGLGFITMKICFKLIGFNLKNINLIFSCYYFFVGIRNHFLFCKSFIFQKLQLF